MKNYYRIIKIHPEYYIPLALLNLVNTIRLMTDQGQNFATDIREVSCGDTKIQLNVLLDSFSKIEESLHYNVQRKKFLTKEFPLSNI